MFSSILFFVFAAVLVCAALGVILARNPVHSALLLVLCFFNSAVIWLLLDAEFLGIVLVLVYVGRGHGAVPVRRHDARRQCGGDPQESFRILAARRRGGGIRGFRHHQRDCGEASGRIELRTAPPYPIIIPTRAHSARRCSRATPIRRSLPHDTAGGERRGHRADAAQRPAEKPRISPSKWRCARRDRVRIVKMASEKRP